MDDRKRVNLFTINRATKSPERKVDKTKQILTMLGLLALVIALPLAVFALIQPEGFFETRRSAAETINLFGLLKNYTAASIGKGTEIPLGDVENPLYCLADKSGEFINTNVSPTTTTYICIQKSVFYSLTKKEVDPNAIYKFASVTFAIRTDVNSIFRYISNATNVSIAEKNFIPTISSTTNVSQQDVKLGESFSLKFKVTDTDVSYGDLIRKLSITGFDAKTTITPVPSSVFNKAAPFDISISGMPSAEKVNSKISYTINATDLIGETGTYSGELNVLPTNRAPIFNDPAYQITPNSGNLRLVLDPQNYVGTIDGNITVKATDPDNDALKYTFYNLPTEIFGTNKVETTSNVLNFSVKEDKIKNEVNNYSFKVNVSDGKLSTEKDITLTVLKKYTKEDVAGWVADFSSTPVTNTLQINFKYTGTSPALGSVDTFWWIFGDGVETETKRADGGNEVTHTYPASGNFTATLVIMNADRKGVGVTKTVTVPSIGDLKPPYASFTAVPLVGNAPLDVRLNPSASSDQDGQIVKYSWNFGDGQTQDHSSAVSFTHTYNATGTYKITLTVTDNTNLTATQSSTVIVGNNQPPVVTLTKPNQGIYGGTASNPNNKINWLVVDSENNTPILYELSLVKSVSGGICNNEETANATAYKLTSGTLTYSNGAYLPKEFAWNTTDSLSGKISDGFYCVKISVIDDTYGQLSTDFSDKPIEILNAKHSPYITTQALPDATVGQSYSATVGAYDEDNDTLTFTLTNNPSYLSISSIGVLSGTPTSSGPVVVTVAVTDGTNLATKTFTINVKATSGQVLPAITIAVNIEVFVGSNGVINWTLENVEDVGKLDLQYSKDGITWNDIATGLSKDINQYNWDVTDLEPGKYLIRIVYYDKNGNLMGASATKELEIAKPEVNTESEPVIYGMKPEENSETVDKTPAISASFKASTGSKVKVESIKVKLDNSDVSAKDGFEGFEGGFAYVPKTNISTGEHTVKVNFEDESGKSAEKTWSFKVKDAETVTTEEKTEETNIYFIAIVVIMILAALVLLAYFIVKKINEERSPRKVFAPKMTQKETSPVFQTPEEKVFRETKASLDRDFDKLRISEKEALEQLREKELPKIKGDPDITKGY